MKIRICSECGQRNLETAWSCANCGETLPVKTIVELDDGLVEVHTTVKDVQCQESVPTQTPAVPETPTNVGSRHTSTERFVLHLVAKGVKDGKNPTLDIARALNIPSSKALNFQENLRKKIGGATNREMILLAKEKGYHLISSQQEDKKLWDRADQLDELATLPNDYIGREETVSIRSRPLSEINRGRLKKSELMESSADKMRDDLYMWGLGLFALGIAHFVFSDFLDPGWGVVIIIIGVINFVIPQRGMFIVNGLILLLAGLMNISSAAVYGGGGWGKFGWFQLIWGVLEMRKYWRYDSVR